VTALLGSYDHVTALLGTLSHVTHARGGGGSGCRRCRRVVAVLSKARCLTPLQDQGGPQVGTTLREGALTPGSSPPDILACLCARQAAHHQIYLHTCAQAAARDLENPCRCSPHSLALRGPCARLCESCCACVTRAHLCAGRCARPDRGV